MPTSIILASTSVYRKQLLERLRISFSVMDPSVDETPIDEPPREHSRRLTIKKTRATSPKVGEVAIGSDQVASLGAQILRKPTTRENAIKQLKASRGKTVIFYTSVAIATPERLHCHTDECRVTFRSDLSDSEIHKYIELDDPLWCAGSFKCESLGPTLFEAVEGKDPTALEGLPLIALCKLLREYGINPLS
jgi:septum formation protein